MATKRLPRPCDPIQLARLVGDILTGQVKDEVEDGKDPAAVELGRIGGLKGVRLRVQRFTAEQRSEICASSS